MVFCFVQNFFSNNTRVRILIFFVAQSANFFLQNLTLRERPFSLKGGGGGYVFFLKNILIPNVAENNILILVEKKKKNDSEFLSYNIMLNSGKKIRALHDKKNCVVRKHFYERNKKPYPPPTPPPPSS